MGRVQQGVPRPPTPADWCQVAAAWSGQASGKEVKEDGGCCLTCRVCKLINELHMRAQSRLLLDWLDLLAVEGAGGGSKEEESSSYSRQGSSC